MSDPPDNVSRNEHNRIVAERDRLLAELNALRGREAQEAIASTVVNALQNSLPNTFVQTELANKTIPFSDDGRIAIAAWIDSVSDVLKRCAVRKSQRVSFLLERLEDEAAEYADSLPEATKRDCLTLERSTFSRDVEGTIREGHIDPRDPDELASAMAVLTKADPKRARYGHNSANQNDGKETGGH